LVSKKKIKCRKKDLGLLEKKTEKKAKLNLLYVNFTEVAFTPLNYCFSISKASKGKLPL